MDNREPAASKTRQTCKGETNGYDRELRSPPRRTDRTWPVWDATRMAERVGTMMPATGANGAERRNRNALIQIAP
jgi:hypothetical protein